MSSAAGRGRSALLVPLLSGWQQLLQSFNPGAPALLRISSGAALISRARGAGIDRVVTSLLRFCQPYLLQPDLAVPAAMLRAKILLELSRPWAGLLLRLRYHGDPPALDHAQWLRRELGSLGVLLDAVASDQAVTLGVLLPEPPRQLSLIHVRAGTRPLALPLTAVSRALPADELADYETAAPRYSLAQCLGLATSATAPRPACLLVPAPQGPLALEVESLEGHGEATVLAPGPLFLARPWYAGFIECEGQAPILVVDPRPLLRTAAPAADTAP